MSESTPGAEPTPEPSPEPTASTPSSSSTSGSTSGSGSANEAVATLKGADRLDLATIGAGVLVLLGSLMPYYTVSVEGFGSESATAWHGFFGWFGALAALVGAGVLVAKILGVSLPVPVRTTVLASIAGVALAAMRRSAD